MTFPHKLIDLTHALDSTIPTWRVAAGVIMMCIWIMLIARGKINSVLRKSECMHGIGTHMDASSHCIPGDSSMILISMI